MKYYYYYYYYKCFSYCEGCLMFDRNCTVSATRNAVRDFILTFSRFFFIKDGKKKGYVLFKHQKHCEVYQFEDGC